MDVIEKAIRNAFEKGNAEDKSFRERVYRSAFAALDRALQQNPNVTVEVAIKRRKALQSKITEIESGFLSAVPASESPSPTPAPTVESSDAEPSGPKVEPESNPAAPEMPEVEPVLPEAAPAARAAPVVEPVVSSVGMPWVVSPEVEVARSREPEAAAHAPGQADPTVRSEPSFEAGPEAGLEAGPAPELVAVEGQERAEARSPEFVTVDRPTESERRSAVEGPEAVPVDPDAEVMRERGRPYAAMFFAVTLFTAGAIGLWWAAQTGLLKLDTQRETTVSSPSKTIESEDFIPEDQEPVLAPKRPGDTDAQKNWISIFTPADADQVNAPTDTSADVLDGDEGQVLRVRSGTSGSAVLFDIGQGVLEQLAGKHVVFDIVARAEEGSETQISVTCNFGELGDCGRKRYAVGHERGEFLFEIDLPGKAPGAGGTIAISSDISNQGKAVDIYEIRVSVAE